MLVLSRQPNERIMIGDDITVTVIEIRRGMVRLGIDAPKDVPVHREEIYEALKRNEIQAAEAARDVKGLAGAGYEHKRYQAPQDDQPLQDKMNEDSH